MTLLRTPPSGHLAIRMTDIQAAAQRLRTVCWRTPVSSSAVLDRAAGACVLMKCEQFQRAGSFKFRGAYNAAVGVETGRDLITVSSGNHGWALGVCGLLLGRRVVVHMPHDAPDSKVEAVRSTGAEVVPFDRYRNTQTEITEQLMRVGSEAYVSAHDDPRVIAGAGTASLEFFAQAGDFDALVVPVGGGGCLAGAGIVARSQAPTCRVIGVEPRASAVNRLSLLAGQRVVVPVPRTIADGQTLSTPGRLTFAIMRHVVDDVVLVTDAEIRAAVTFLRERCGLIVEPSGACGVAALLARRVDGLRRNGRVGVLLTGGNGADQRE